MSGQLDHLSRTPIAYGYARVSHVNSFEKGESIPAQYNRIESYYERELKPQGVQWGGCEDDATNVSAYRIAFRCRPAGKKLLSILKAGDHLIVDKPDRFFRSLRDFVHTMDHLDTIGVNVHIVNFLGQAVQNTTPMGKFILRMMVMIGEMESAIKSERIREAMAIRKLKGYKKGKHLPVGCRVTMKNGEPIIAWCEKKRTIMKEVVRLIDEERLEWAQVFPKIEAFTANIENREPRTEFSHRDMNAWKTMYKYETAFAYLGIREPSQIPVKEAVCEGARQYKRRRTLERASKNPHKYHKQVSDVPKIKPEQLLAHSPAVFS